MYQNRTVRRSLPGCCLCSEAKLTYAIFCKGQVSIIIQDLSFKETKIRKAMLSIDK